MAQLTAGQRRYREYLKTPRWRLLRWLRKVIDLGVCQDCLKVGRIRRYGLQAHHTTYANKGGNFFSELDDLVMLCDSCHAKRHGKAARDD